MKLNFGNRTIRNGLLFGLLLTIQPLYSQEVPVPVRIQYPLLLKILSFDKNLTQRLDKEIIIVVIFQSKNKFSNEINNNFRRSAEESTIKAVRNFPVRLKFCDADSDSVLIRIEAHKPTALVVNPMRAFNIRALAALCIRNNILSYSTTPDYLAAGIAVSVDNYRQKPRILINIKACRQQGTEFSSRLLRFAKVIESEE